MARYRTIKPDLFSDGALTECCREARFLFVGLLPFVDDMGRRRYSAKQLKNEVFPGDTDIDAQKVAYWFQQLVKAGVVELYQVGTILYFRIPLFLRHQKIQHPSHADSPPSPSENGTPQCLCDECRKRVPGGTSRVFMTSDDNSRPLMNPHDSSNRERERVSERGSERGKEREKPSAVSTNENPADQTHSSASSAENRRAERRAVEEIATRILDLLRITPNQLLVQTVTKSIEVKARAKNCTPEAAAQQIAARAAFVAAESPPENWVEWFEDVRYEYVPQGDRRLDDRRIEARPICGGSRCSEGWETVKVGDVPVLRRCPDCERLWRDQGV